MAIYGVVDGGAGLQRTSRRRPVFTSNANPLTDMSPGISGDERIGWRLTASGYRFIVRGVPEGRMVREINQAGTLPQNYPGLALPTGT